MFTYAAKGVKVIYGHPTARPGQTQMHARQRHAPEMWDGHRLETPQMLDLVERIVG